MRRNAIILIVLSTFLWTACGGRMIRKQLSDVETYIQKRPDSALMTLRAIDTTKLTTHRLKADYALLHAIALDKNWIDTTDTGVVMPAVEYYDRHKPLSARAKPWYYLGRIQYNGRNYDEAIVSFIRAKEYAEPLADNRFKALICQAIADTYNISHLYEEALRYAQEAYKYDLLAKDTLLANGTLFSIAVLHNNLKDYAKADSLLSQLYLSKQTDSHLRPRIIAAFAQLTASYKNDYEKSTALFEQALSEEKGFGSYNTWGAYAYSLYRVGNQEKSEQIFTDMERAGLKDQYVYQIWKSRIEQMEGNYQRAYFLLDDAILDQTEGVTKLLRQSAIKAQRDFFTLQNETLKMENRLRKWINLLLAFSSLASAFTAVVLIRRYRENVRRKNQELIETAQELLEQREALNALSAENRDISSRMIQLRQDFFHFSQDSFKELSDLCNAYYKTEGRSSQPHAVYSEVRGLLNNLGVGEERYPTLEQRVNEQFDHVMDHFRAEHPDHREPFFQTACYLFAGFKTRIIALVLGQDEQNVYKTRSLLRKEVETKETPHKKDFLLLLNKSAT